MNTILFDLDGTLLPMDLDVFIKTYFYALKTKFENIGFDGDQCIQGLIAGIKAMYKNTGETTNEDCFWNAFEGVTHIDKKDCVKPLEDFYIHEFPLLDSCSEGKSLKMIEAVHVLKEKGYKLILATNPLFPFLATKARVEWAGLSLSDFDVVTSYENAHYTKPNIMYYKELLSSQELSVDDCMMVGNDPLEDGVVESMGIPLYLVNDYLIQREGKIQSKWYGSSSDFLQFVKTLPSI